MVRRGALTTSLALLFTHATFSGSVFAEDVNDLLEVLGESVVTGASRSAESADDAPATSTVITAEQLRLLGIHTLRDALNYLSLGAFSHDRMGGAEVGMRGVALTRDSNNHVLIVLDGIVMNEQAGGGVFLHDIPIALVDHIEVILGPGSVLYGSNAMLGVINVVTKNGAASSGVRASFSLGASPPMTDGGAIASPSLESMGHDNHYALSVGRKIRWFGKEGNWILGANIDDFRGPGFVFPQQPLPLGPDGTRLQMGPNAEPGYWGGPVEEQWFRRVASGYYRLDVGNVSWNTLATTSRLAMPQMDLFENRNGAYDDARNANTNTLVLSGLGLNHRFDEKLRGLGRAYFGYSRALRSRHVIGHDGLIPGIERPGLVDPIQCPTGGEGPCRQEAWSISRWQGVELQSTYDWLGDGAYSTMLGLDGKVRTAAYEFVSFDQLTGLSYGSDPAFTRWHGGGNLQANEYAVGAYVQQSAKPWSYLAFNAGARMDFDTRIPSDSRWDALSPRVAVIASPTDNLSLKLIYAKAFRSPSFLELHIVNGRLIPNDDLKPETVHSFEAVSSYRNGSHALSLGAFYTKWNNLIELQILQAQAPASSKYNNVPGIQNYGGNLSYEASLLDQNLRFGLNSTYAIARRELSELQQERNAEYLDDDTVPITVAPKLYGNARVSYSFWSSSVALAAGYFGRRIADQAYYGGDPSNLAPRPEAPEQLELRGAFTSVVPGIEQAEYQIGADYAFSAYEPYVVGPNQGLPLYLSPSPRVSDLALVNRLTVFVGLSIALDSVDGDPGASSVAGEPNPSEEGIETLSPGAEHPSAPLHSLPRNEEASPVGDSLPSESGAPPTLDPDAPEEATPEGGEALGESNQDSASPTSSAEEVGETPQTTEETADEADRGPTP